MTERAGAAPRPAGDGDAVLGVRPRLAFEPTSIDEAAEAMRACARDRLHVAFIGGGTDLGLGAPPARLDAAIHTRGLSRVVEHAPSDQIVAVEAGITLAELQRALAAHGQRLAIDPPLPDRATAGGVLAAGAFGPLRTRYGPARDLVIGITVVRADGVVARGGGKVVKNVAGFDLPRLFSGSLGTLGLVAAVTFRLHPLPESRVTVRIPGLDAEGLRAAWRGWRDAQLEPAAAAALLDGGRFDLLVRFEGFGPGVAGQVERLLGLGSRAGFQAERLEDAAAGAAWAAHDAARTEGTLRVRLSLPPAAAAPAAEALATLLRALPGGRAVWYPTLGLGFACGDPAAPEAAASAIGDARGAARRHGGSLVLAAAPDPVRARTDPWGPAPSAIEVMRRLKAQLDPDGRLAPGRMVGGI